MPRTGREAIAWARDHMTWEPGYCLQWVRSSFDVGSLYPDANTAWRNANRKHRTEYGVHCPRGVPIWWTGGSHGYGHVALSLGDGWCLSTDAGGSGKVAKVRISDLTRRWGLNFQGWTEDINGVRVFTPKPPPPAAGWERVRIRAVGPGRPDSKDQEVVKRRIAQKMGAKKYSLDMDAKDVDSWGPALTTAYRAWQERLGLPDRYCDGRPGEYSLRKLGLEVVK
jgi:hypothetical protein